MSDQMRMKISTTTWPAERQTPAFGALKALAQVNITCHFVQSRLTVSISTSNLIGRFYRKVAMVVCPLNQKSSLASVGEYVLKTHRDHRERLSNLEPE